MMNERMLLIHECRCRYGCNERLYLGKTVNLSAAVSASSNAGEDASIIAGGGAVASAGKGTGARLGVVRVLLRIPVQRKVLVRVRMRMEVWEGVFVCVCLCGYERMCRCGHELGSKCLFINPIAQKNSCFNTAYQVKRSR